MTTIGGLEDLVATEACKKGAESESGKYARFGYWGSRYVQAVAGFATCGSAVTKEREAFKGVGASGGL